MIATQLVALDESLAFVVFEAYLALFKVLNTLKELEGIDINLFENPLCSFLRSLTSHIIDINKHYAMLPKFYSPWCSLKNPSKGSGGVLMQHDAEL